MKKAIMSVLTMWIMVNVGLFSILMFSSEKEIDILATIIIVDDDGTSGVDCNYTKIQWAIDNASIGDTVFVKNGTYYETVIVNKTINLTGENKDNTIIDGNNNSDVINITNNWVNITGFTITHGGGSDDAGILINSENNSIYGNNITLNDYYGIYVLGNRNNIHNNSITYNYRGIFIENSDNNSIRSNYLSNNTQMTIRLQYSKGNEIKENEAKTGGISLWGSNQNNVSENKCGIGLTNSSENKITENTGLISLFWDSKRNDIIGNNASNFDTGIYVSDSYENNIMDNNFSSNSEYGIHLYFSERNNIFNNTICSNGEYGIYLDGCPRTNTVDNQISFNQIWGIYMASASGNITNNDILNNGNGINAFLCSFNNIGFNNISNNNGTAIRFDESSDNNITNNMIFNNSDGIRLIGPPPFLGSKDNIIYHNNIINNANQSYDEHYENYWDNDYPLGGNYWSDYSGNDSYKGPNQDIPGSDGIGDTPYIIDADSRDNYPLIQPYKPLENYLILKQGWNLISVPFIQEEQNLTRVLGSIDSWYDAVQWYNSPNPNKPWKHHKVGKPFGNDLFELNESMAFWIHITNPGDTIFLYNGSQPTSNQSITLHPGWNMVGYPSLTNRNRTTALNNLTFGVEVDAIWTFDAATKNWEEIGIGDYFEVGRGYWIHATQECVWEVPI